MSQIGAFEAKNTLGSLLDRAERGEEIVITRHGRPVAKLGPLTPAIDHDAVTAAMDRIRARTRGLAGGGVDWETLKVDRDAGRP
jgi:prevent-host-death family protein